VEQKWEWAVLKLQEKWASKKVESKREGIVTISAK
jgi:hypothetical protein